jgi:hypothetical protein
MLGVHEVKGELTSTTHAAAPTLERPPKDEFLTSFSFRANHGKTVGDCPNFWADAAGLLASTVGNINGEVAVDSIVHWSGDKGVAWAEFPAEYNDGPERLDSGAKPEPKLSHEKAVLSDSGDVDNWK